MVNMSLDFAPWTTRQRTRLLPSRDGSDASAWSAASRRSSSPLWLGSIVPTSAAARPAVATRPSGQSIGFQRHLRSTPQPSCLMHGATLFDRLLMSASWSRKRVRVSVRQRVPLRRMPLGAAPMPLETHPSVSIHRYLKRNGRQRRRAVHEGASQTPRLATSNAPLDAVPDTKVPRRGQEWPAQRVPHSFKNRGRLHLRACRDRWQRVPLGRAVGHYPGCALHLRGWRRRRAR